MRKHGIYWIQCFRIDIVWYGLCGSSWRTNEYKPRSTDTELHCVCMTNRTLNLLSATTFSDKYMFFPIKYICYKIHSFNLYSRNVLYQNLVPNLLLRFWLRVWLKRILWNKLGPMLQDRQCRPLCGIDCLVHPSWRA